MIGIKVCRNPAIPSVCSESDSALNWGDDISDPLLTENSVALERGRVEIDASYTNRIIASLNIAQRQYVQMGTVIGINEGGLVKNGMLKSLNISLVKENDSFSTATQIVVERNT
jgi:hypothetical protein